MLLPSNIGVRQASVVTAVGTRQKIWILGV